MADPWFPLSMGASDPGAHLHTRFLNYSCNLTGIKAHSQHRCRLGALAQVRATLRHVFSPDPYHAEICPDIRPHGDTAALLTSFLKLLQHLCARFAAACFRYLDRINITFHQQTLAACLLQFSPHLFAG